MKNPPSSFISWKPADLRRAILERRKKLAPADRARLSVAICDKLLQEMPGALFKGLKVGFYRALFDELDPASLAQVLTRSGAQLYYPRIVSRETQMTFAHPTGESDFERAGFGFLQPAAHCPIASVSELDVIFVPGVAFSEQGDRVGRGVGHYDRALVAAPDRLRIALGFDLQLLPSGEQIDAASWDQKIHWILTESRSIKLFDLNQWQKRHRI